MKTLKMKKTFPNWKLRPFCCGTVLLFIPLIMMGGKLAARVVMNLWNLIEPGGYRG